MATPQEIAEAVRRSKREVLADVRSGRVPGDVRTFSRLHDYVDANEYGGLCDPKGPFSMPADSEVGVDIDGGNAVQDAVHHWLRSPEGAEALHDAEADGVRAQDHEADPSLTGAHEDCATCAANLR